MGRDARILVPIVLFVLSFIAVVTGLALLLSLRWDAVLEDVRLGQSSESNFNIPTPTLDYVVVSNDASPITIPLPTSIPTREKTLVHATVPTSHPTSTETVLERQVHFASVRTGIDDIDQVIDLVLGVDDNAIRNALVFSLIECTHEDGLGGPPKCREGEEEGAEVEVLPILGPEGHFFRQDEIEDWRGIGVVGLYAAYEVSTRAFSDENYPAGEFAAMFMESDHQFLVLQIVNGGIVRIDYVMGGDPEDKIDREARRVILAPLPHGVIPSTGLGNTITGWAPNLSTPTPSPGDIWLTPTPGHMINTPTPSPGDYQSTPTPGSAGTIEPTPTISVTPSAPWPTPLPSDPTESVTPSTPSETASPAEPTQEATPSATPTSSAPPPEFTNLILTRYPYLRKSQIVFPKGTPYIYAVWDYAGMEAGMVVRREWYRYGELWLEREELWDFAKYGSSGTMFDVSIYDFVDGLDSGWYGLKLYTDGIRLVESPQFWVKEWAYPVEPQASPDGNLLVTIERPGTIFIQEWGGKRREFTTFDEVADLDWFPGGEHLFVVNVNRFEQLDTSSMEIGLEGWVVDIKTGEKRMITPSTLNFRRGTTSPGGRYVAGISGTGWGDACFVDSYLMVLKLDRDHNHIATYRLKDFGEMGESLGHDVWDVHPSNIQWVNRYQFTAELTGYCLPTFVNGVYLFDLKTMEAKIIRRLVARSEWSQ
jgi:hypothetical protein